jgi:hypothetical protein
MTHRAKSPAPQPLLIGAAVLAVVLLLLRMLAFVFKHGRR